MLSKGVKMESKYYYYPKEAYAQQNQSKKQGQNSFSQQPMPMQQNFEQQNPQLSQNLFGQDNNFNIQNLLSILGTNSNTNLLSSLAGGAPQLSNILSLLSNKKKSDQKTSDADEKFVKVKDFYLKKPTEDI